MAAPRTDFDWSAYDPKINNACGHIECTFNARAGEWTEPRFVESQSITIHGLAPALHYGQQIYEGITACRDPNGKINIFRPEANATRINHSASVLAMPPIPENLFMQCVIMAVNLNAEYCPPHEVNGALYVRPVFIGSSCQIGLDAPDEFMFLVYTQAHIAFHGRNALRARIAEEFDRAATRGTGAAKVGGNYAPVLRWSRIAKREGFNILLHVDSRTQTEIEEFSSSAFIGICNDVDNVKVVVSDSDAIIDSITVDCVVSLAKSFGWTVEKRPIKLTELDKLQEVIAAGTASGLVPVQEIHQKSTDRQYTFDPRGPAFEKLWSALSGIQKGTVDDSFGWLCRASTRTAGGVKEGADVINTPIVDSRAASDANGKGRATKGIGYDIYEK